MTMEEVEENVPTSAGLSSFNLLDERKFFTALALEPGMTLLDFGCGVGNYAIPATGYIGERGRVFAVDLWEEGIETLVVRSAMAGIDNITSAVCAAGTKLPINDQAVDVCLLATVIHILVQEQVLGETLSEVRRVLRPGGKVAVVEFYKKEGPPGPPLSWRLAPEELQGYFAPAGFQPTGTFAVGPHNYLMLYSIEPEGGSFSVHGPK